MTKLRMSLPVVAALGVGVFGGCANSPLRMRGGDDYAVYDPADGRAAGGAVAAKTAGPDADSAAVATVGRQERSGIFDGRVFGRRGPRPDDAVIATASAEAGPGRQSKQSPEAGESPIQTASAEQTIPTTRRRPLENFARIFEAEDLASESVPHSTRELTDPFLSDPAGPSAAAFTTPEAGKAAVAPTAAAPQPSGRFAAGFDAQMAALGTPQKPAAATTAPNTGSVTDDEIDTLRAEIEAIRQRHAAESRVVATAPDRDSAGPEVDGEPPFLSGQTASGAAADTDDHASQWAWADEDVAGDSKTTAAAGGTDNPFADLMSGPTPDATRDRSAGDVAAAANAMTDAPTGETVSPTSAAAAMEASGRSQLAHQRVASLVESAERALGEADFDRAERVARAALGLSRAESLAFSSGEADPSDLLVQIVTARDAANAFDPFAPLPTSPPAAAGPTFDSTVTTARPGQPTSAAGDREASTSPFYPASLSAPRGSGSPELPPLSAPSSLDWATPAPPADAPQPSDTGFADFDPSAFEPLPGSTFDPTTPDTSAMTVPLPQTASIGSQAAPVPPPMMIAGGTLAKLETPQQTPWWPLALTVIVGMLAVFTFRAPPETA